MKFGDKLTKLLVVAGIAIAGCSQQPLALGQAELSDALVEAGLDSATATCAAGLEVSEAKSVEDFDSQRLSGFIIDCREAEVALDQLEVEREELTQLAFSDPDTYGDDPELDLLWDGCEAGSGADCDELFSISPLQSDYEDFAGSCGRRPDVLRCSELDSEDALQPVPEIAVVREPEVDQETDEDVDGAEDEVSDDLVEVPVESPAAALIIE